LSVFGEPVLIVVDVEASTDDELIETKIKNSRFLI